MTVHANSKLEILNAYSEEDAKEELAKCCGASQWVEKMLARRPFHSFEELFSAADDIWFKLAAEDWLESFSHHPRIGDVDSLRAKFASTASFCENEQKSVCQASEEVLHQLASLNDEYFEKYGFIFIVCATGKTAEQMLEILKRRMPNNIDAELKVAAGEQAKITKIRLEKLVL
ncbi:MAG: 2-oxo-4-hydroxy-4-carboxy-5-ureidoimidazoline decarboxylase [Candidatus Melainabacteria bacterium]|nr:2-oxo-4-hydroxy-4-carboxy-5-ureidoimidazoline decarboxylase [Candidatus Melainabacteria bacterium]